MTKSINLQWHSFFRTWSIRRTLIGILLCLSLSVWSFSAIVVYLDADQESQELFDQSLAETAHLLLTLADHEVQERMANMPSAMAESNNDAHSQYLLFQIWDEKRLLYKNKGASDTPFSASGAVGFGWTVINGQPWRTYVTWDTEHQLQIQVGEPVSHRKEISGRFAYKLLVFALFIIPLLIAGIWWTVNRVFQALHASAEEVSQRTPNDLRLVSLEGRPIEVRPLLNAINRLFERVSHTLANEQRFTADAAHELRTPLAAIKTNLQIIQRARNDGERTEAIQGLGASVDRATRLVEQLMTLARLDPQNNQQAPLRIADLSAVIAQQVPYWQSQAAQKHLHFDVQLSEAQCPLHQDSFLILLRNLLDNAFRYTSEEGKVTLRCGTDSRGVYMLISDDGVGIPAAMRERVFERFMRLAGADKPGSGLGLSIVKQIADMHHATLELSDGLDHQAMSKDTSNDVNKGLSVRLSWSL
ncbi:ATP-binding protein [Undibacterium sp. SXout7W]|uniref:ATP-binding protein n=1 Tax=Undibacterium sp. SXout7W TaxID=3413049 RepID=UPI003BF12935